MISIRTATEDDAEELLAIYAPYVKQTAITFEYDVPSKKDFKSRISHTLEKYPYLVAEEDGKIVGYAYVSPFKERAAYDWSVETSIYVDMIQKRKGIGRLLYDRLEEILKKQGILNVNACIGYPQIDDEYLTKDSVYFHEKLGYHIGWNIPSSADTSLDAGMIWYGWRNSLENTACREISRMLSHLAISVVKCFISVVCAFSNITCTGK